MNTISQLECTKHGNLNSMMHSHLDSKSSDIQWVESSFSIDSQTGDGPIGWLMAKNWLFKTLSRNYMKLVDGWWLMVRKKWMVDGSLQHWDSESGHLHLVLHYGPFRGHRCLPEPLGPAKHSDGLSTWQPRLWQLMWQLMLRQLMVSGNRGTPKSSKSSIFMGFSMIKQ